MQNPQYRFIGPSPWSDKARKTEEIPEKLSSDSTRGPGGITGGILGRCTSFFWSWIISIIRIVIRTIILMVVMLLLTSSKRSRCYIAGSRLYPAMQCICAFDRATGYSSLGPLCISLNHARSPRDFCENYDPFRFASDVFLVVNQDGPVNYASSDGGASIVTEFTSQTHGRTPCSGSTSEIWACNLEKNGHINSPAVILEESLVHGECWEFSGEKGQVAINLTEPVVITHISLDRLPQETRRRAPRNMTLWALVDNRDHHDAPHSGDQGTAPNELPRSALRVRPESHSRVQNLLDFLPIYPSDTTSFVHILSFEYDINKAAVTRQSFFLHDTQIKTQMILLKVDSNFGGETTCLPPVSIYST